MVAMHRFHDERCCVAEGLGLLPPPRFTRPPKPAGLAVIRCAHFPSPGCARLRVPTDIKSWRTRLQPIQTATEITAHIKILPAQQPYLYQKLSQKATQLRLLGITYEQIQKLKHQ